MSTYKELVAKNILLVEDDPSLGFIIMDELETVGCKVTLCEEGLSGLRSFQMKEWDLVLLDVMLPGMDGFSLAAEIRKHNKQVFIIFLTAKSMDADRLKGLSGGGDDYLTKPFNMEELKLRMLKLFQRASNNQTTAETLYQLGKKYRFDTINQLLLCTDDNSELRLTKKESDLLAFLCKNINRTVKREETLVAIWGVDDYFLGRSMDVYITKLRKHLRKDASIKIENIHGVGFRLVVS